MFDMLFDTGIDIDAKDNLQRTTLHWASVYGDAYLIRCLLNSELGPRRADISVTESHNKTAVHLAVAHGQKDALEVLLKCGANVNAIGDGGWSPLHIVRFVPHLWSSLQN